MNINWKVRIKNPLFWVQVALAVIVPILGYMGITAEDLTSWRVLGEVLFEAVKNPYVLALVLVSTWNAIVDPTTKGISDSKEALTYTIPKAEVEE
jgi:phi LC3 family holin